jgi:chitinase
MGTPKVSSKDATREACAPKKNDACLASQSHKQSFRLSRAGGLALLLGGALLLGVSAGTARAELPAGRPVFANYPGWQYWAMPPSAIDFTGVSCVVHFSAKPTSAAGLDFNSHNLFPDRIRDMVKRAHDNRACAMLTVGGANTRAGFQAATATEALKRTLVNNIVNAVTTYGYDGVDIDWELLHDDDALRFQGLIRSLRARLDSVAPSKLLTASVGYQFGTSGVQRTTGIVAGVKDQLNYVHLMAYALAGPWGGWVSWHNSALSNGGILPPSGKPLPSAEEMVKQYVAAGIPAAKLTLGLAFFGRQWTGGAGTPTGGVTAPRQKWNAATPPRMGGEYQYHQILARPDFQTAYRWDDVAKVPYLSVDKPGSAEDQFVPFENPASIREKVRFAAAKGLGGLMVWELRGGYVAGAEAGQRQPLLDALKAEYLARYKRIPGARR